MISLRGELKMFKCLSYVEGCVDRLVVFNNRKHYAKKSLHVHYYLTQLMLLINVGRYVFFLLTPLNDFERTILFDIVHEAGFVSSFNIVLAIHFASFCHLHHLLYTKLHPKLQKLLQLIVIERNSSIFPQGKFQNQTVMRYIDGWLTKLINGSNMFTVIFGRQSSTLVNLLILSFFPRTQLAENSNSGHA